MRGLRWLLLLILGLSNIAYADAAADRLFLGDSTVVAGSLARIPVYIRDVAGTPLGMDQTTRIQSIRFSLKFTNSAYVAGCSSTPFPDCQMTFTPAGVLASLKPGTEKIETGSDTIGIEYVYDRATQPIAYTLNHPTGDLIGYIELSLAGTAPKGATIAFTFNESASVTALADSSTGSATETVSNGGLEVAGASLTVVSCDPPTSQNLAITTGGACDASGSCSPASDAVLSVDGVSGFDLDACPTTYSWNFGDGSPPSTTRTARHAFATTGTYSVNVTVSRGSVSATVPRTLSVHQVSPPPLPGPGGSCQTVNAQNVHINWAGGCDFMATCRANELVFFSLGTFGLNPTECTTVVSWRFDDTGGTSNGTNVTHTFVKGGATAVHMTVSRATGSVTIDQTFTVSGGTGGQPSCDCAVFANGVAIVNQAVTFQSVAPSCPTQLTYAWNFGDGGTAGGAAAAHAYLATGSYTWTLTATDASGTTFCVRAGSILVVPPPPPRRRVSEH